MILYGAFRHKLKNSCCLVTRSGAGLEALALKLFIFFFPFLLVDNCAVEWLCGPFWKRSLSSHHVASEGFRLVRENSSITITKSTFECDYCMILTVLAHNLVTVPMR